MNLCYVLHLVISIFASSVTALPNNQVDAPHIVVVVKHHKTGYILTQCIFDGLAAEDNWEQGLYYINKLTDEVLADVRDKLQGSKQFFIVNSGWGLPMACVQDDYQTMCPFTRNWHPDNKISCPCRNNQSHCFQVEGCLPQLKEVATTLPVVLTVRNPLNLIISAYLYHSQTPPPESEIPWMNGLLGRDLEDWWRQAGLDGDADNVIARLNISLESAPYENMTYYQILTSLPPEKGILLEYIRSIFDIYQIAREYIVIGHQPNVFISRIESWDENFDDTLSRMLLHTALADHVSEKHLGAVRQKCDVHRWTDAERNISNHVTVGKHKHKELHKTLSKILFEDEQIRSRLCTAIQILGYHHDLCTQVE